MSTRAICALTLGFLGGCGCGDEEDEWVSIPSGSWVAEGGDDATGTELDADHAALNTDIIIDRDAETVTFVTSELEIELAFESWPEVDWPSDCPGNCSASRVEVLALGESVALGDLEFSDPVVYASCADGDPATRVVLAEAPERGTDMLGGGEASVLFYP